MLRITLRFLIASLMVALTACSSGGLGAPANMSTSAFPVETVFREFYQALGAEALLGRAISPVELHENNLRCQYTERVLMCLDPDLTDADRFSLFPLGLELGIQPDTFVDWAAIAPDARVVDGIPIYEKFVPLYDRLYGARFVGRPLTTLRINLDMHRAEQFFENVGFYQDLNNPDSPVYLIPYGAYLCGGKCSSRLNEYWSIVKSSTVDQPFAPSVARLGGPSVFGSLLLMAQVAEDGSLEQAYSNAIFYAPPDNPNLVRLRPLPLMLGYEVQPLAEPVIHEQLVFYEVEGGLGHNVPLPFDAFIANHGGRELSGDPISEVVKLDGQNLYQQCFENYCLLFDPAAPDSLKVRMAPLAKDYLAAHPAPAEAQIQDLFSPQRIALVVSTDHPTIGGDEDQVIRIAVQERETGQPLERVEATLVLNIPGSTIVRGSLPPTGADGMSSLTILPQRGLPNGTRLWYQVCLNLPSQQPICQVDSYLLWDID